MIIYVLLLVWIIIVNIFSRSKILIDRNGNGHTRATKLHVLLTMGVLIIVIGLRSNIADTSAHIITFKQVQPGIEGFKHIKEYGNGLIYRALSVICRTISGNYHFYLFVVTALSGLFIIIPLRKRTDFYRESIMLFMLMGMYAWMLNGIRQFLAVTLTFYCMTRARKDRIGIDLFLLFLAVGIHSSAIILIPMYFIARGRAWNWKVALMIVLGILSVLFINQFISLLDLAIVGTEYEGYTDQFAKDNGSNPIRTFIFLIPPLLAFIKRRKVEEQHNEMINICINMSIAAAVVSLIANFTSGILIGAVTIYFSLYNIILIPWLFHVIYRDRRGKHLKTIMYLGYFVYFFTVSYPYYSDILFGGRYFPAWHFI